MRKEGGIVLLVSGDCSVSLFSGPDEAEPSAAEWAIADQRPAIVPVHDAPDNGEAKTVAA